MKNAAFILLWRFLDFLRGGSPRLANEIIKARKELSPISLDVKKLKEGDYFATVIFKKGHKYAPRANTTYSWRHPSKIQALRNLRKLFNVVEY